MEIRLGLQETIAVGVIAFVIITLLFYFFVWSPMSGNLARIREEQRSEQQKVQSSQVTLQRLEALRKEAPKIETEMIELTRQMPDEAGIPGLIIELEEMASQAGLNFVSFSPSPPSEGPTGEYQSIKLNFGVEGYFNKARSDGGSLLDFLYRLEHSPREIKINNVSISPGAGGLPALKMTFQAETFMLPSVEATPTAKTATPTVGQ